MLWVLIAILVASYLVVKCVIALWVYFRPKDRYQVGMPGYWKHHFTEAMFEGFTPSGFILYYSVAFNLTRVDDEAFRDHQMLEESHVRINVEETWTHYQAFMYPSGPWFMAYEWARNPLPSMATFRMNSNARQNGFARDPAGHTLMEAIRERRDQLPPDKQTLAGCEIRVSGIKPEWVKAAIVRNLQMITQEEHALAEADARYLRMQEITVIKAMQFQLSLLQPKQIEVDKNVSIESEVTGVTIRLKWIIQSDTMKAATHRLVGYRKSDGYFEGDAFDSNGLNGQRIVDSANSSSCLDCPEPGHTYYYTFFFMPVDATKYRKYGLVRMSISVPTSDGVAQLQTLLEGARAKKMVDERESREIEEPLRRFNLRYRQKVAMTKVLKDTIAEVKLDPSLSNEDKTKLCDWLDAEMKEADISLV